MRLMKTKKTALAQEFIQRLGVDPLCQEVGWVATEPVRGKTGNVAEVNPSGLVILPRATARHASP